MGCAHHSGRWWAQPALRRKQQPAGGFEEVDHVVQKAGGRRAIDKSMIVGQRKRHHQANGDLVSVTQKVRTPLALNQKVLVIAGNQARVVPDYTLPPDITAAKAPEPVKPAEAVKPEAALPGQAKPEAALPDQAKPAASLPATADEPKVP